MGCRASWEQDQGSIYSLPRCKSSLKSHFSKSLPHLSQEGVSYPGLFESTDEWSAKHELFDKPSPLVTATPSGLTSGEHEQPSPCMAQRIGGPAGGFRLRLLGSRAEGVLYDQDAGIHCSFLITHHSLRLFNPYRWRFSPRGADADEWPLHGHHKHEASAEQLASFGLTDWRTMSKADGAALTLPCGTMVGTVKGGLIAELYAVAVKPISRVNLYANHRIDKSSLRYELGLGNSRRALFPPALDVSFHPVPRTCIISDPPSHTSQDRCDRIV